MENIRVVLVDMPRLLREIVTSIASSDLCIVRQYDDPVDLVAAVDRDAAQVVITGAEAHEPREVERLLAERPAVKVFGITADGSSTTLHELMPRRHALGELSVDRLDDAVRRAVERDRRWRSAAQ